MRLVIGSTIAGLALIAACSSQPAKASPSVVEEWYANCAAQTETCKGDIYYLSDMSVHRIDNVEETIMHFGSLEAHDLTIVDVAPRGFNFAYNRAMHDYYEQH